MSNTDFDTTPEDFADPSSFILNEQRRATMSALTSLDANPEDAARAHELSQATGVPGPIIDGNLENFEQQHKAALTASLLNNNQYLAQYANSTPLAPKISNDDWGQLDQVSQKLMSFKAPGLSIMQAAAKGFKDNLDTGNIGEDIPVEPETNRFLWSLVSAAYGLGVVVPSRVFTAGLGGFEAGFSQLQQNLGSDPNAAERRSREITGMLEAELMGISGRAGMAHAPAAEIPPEIASAAKKGFEAYQIAKPYIDNGAEPPVGLHPLTDQMHAEQAKLDVKLLDDTYKEAQKSATRERAPELFADFIRQHTDRAISIDADAIRELYGAKEGEPLQIEQDDGKLGWVPHINEQLALANASGGRVEVPLADWLAKAEPDVADALHDQIAVQPGGMTLEETKEASKPVAVEAPKEGEEEAQVTAPTPVEAIRQAASFNPSKPPGIIPASIQPESTAYEHYTGAIVHPYANFPLREGLKQINYDLLPEGIPSILNEAFRERLQKVVGDVPVSLVSTDQMKKLNPNYESEQAYSPAYYDPNYHTIFLTDTWAAGYHGHAKAAELLLHEGMHAVTYHAMRTFPDLATKVEALRDGFEKYLKENDPELLKDDNHEYALKVTTDKDGRKFADEFLSQARNESVQHTLSMAPLPRQLAERLGLEPAKGQKFWDAIRQLYRRMMQKMFPGHEIPMTFVDAILHVQKEFESAHDSAGKVRRGEPVEAPKEPELPQAGTTRMEDRDLFTKAAAIGMTKDQYARYQELIAKRGAEDAEFHAKQAEKAERERQTQEWKENFSRVRKEVQADLYNRPDIAADRFMNEGELYGEKVGKPSKDMHPDDIGGLFGYQSGEAMTSALDRLKQERDLEGLTTAAHFSKLVDAETERRMRREYGNLEENILRDAQDHVLSQTQFDLLHEETLAYATKANAEFSFTKEDVKAWVKDHFNSTPVGSHSVEKYLASAGRGGRDAEQALLEGRPGDAFKAKQQQYFASLLANEAKRLEKERSSFDRLAKRFNKREVSGVPAEYTNWIHDILMRTGNVVRRSVQDLQQAIGRESHGSLEEFVNSKNNDARIWETDENAPSDFQIMPVAPFLFDQSYRKQIDDMAVDEFRAVNNSIKTLAKNGTDENKILIGGEKADLNETLSKMVDQLNSMFGGKKEYAFGHRDKGFTHTVKTYWASLLQIESIFNRFDRGNPKGIFRKVVTQPIFEGSHELNTLETKYSRMYKALPDFGDLKKKVENPLFPDPLNNYELKDGFTRGNLLAVLQNVGNPSQLDKLARGFMKAGSDGRIVKDDVNEFKNNIMQWLFKNTTKEDWDRAQALGDIFEQAFEESSRMYHNLSGVAPEKIDIRSITTPFGVYEGWYHPIIYDPLRPGTSKKLMGQNPLEDGAYYRVATPSGYTQRRTGYAAPILLSFDAIPFRLKSMLNDIAMRPPVTEVAKVFYDPKFQMAITRNYNKEIKDLLLPYLKDIAGQKMYKDAAQTTANRVLEAFRQNLSATLIGLNPSTVMKHGPTAAMLSIKEVGTKDFLRELTSLVSMNDELGERNWNFAMKGGIVDGKEWNGSEELQRRHRNWQETLSGAQQDLFGENTLRNTIIKLGATPVAISDLLSAVPTWLAAYKAQIRSGEAHGPAVTYADTAVRRAHGSSAVAARPRIMRGGALAQMATPFYTFFNEMFQRQYEMAWRAKDALGQFSEGEYKAGLKELPNLMNGLWAYVVFPALVEQMVSPIATGNQPTSVKAALWGARTIASSLPGIRDMAEAFLGGRDPTVGLYSTGAKMFTDIGRDVIKGHMLNKKQAGATIKHAITAFGAATGLANAQMGRTAQFVFNYVNGLEHPKDTGDILRGLYHGTTKEQRR